MSCINTTKLCTDDGVSDQFSAGESAVAPPACLGGRTPPSSNAVEVNIICEPGAGAGAAAGAAPAVGVETGGAAPDGIAAEALIAKAVAATATTKATFTVLSVFKMGSPRIADAQVFHSAIYCSDNKTRSRRPHRTSVH
jgi:hypothetical protein